MRSLTAERIYEGFSVCEVKSAGTQESARTPVTQEHIDWADMIFVMEKEHLQFLKDNFGEALEGKAVICLNIPDVYPFMHPDLIEELKGKLSEYVEVPE
jgi:predicted protein tyrosine phosphatase